MIVYNDDGTPKGIACPNAIGEPGAVGVTGHKPTVALAMIVKDEEANLRRCLDAARPLIDALVLIDTGSTDGTTRVAREWAKENGVLLRWSIQPWVNFKVNRTNLFRFAEGAADWFLLLDCDMVVHVPDVIRNLDAVDSWHGRVKFRGLDYSLPMLVRGSKPWLYEGVAHSYLACAETFDEAELPGLWVEDYSSTGPEKLKRDLVLLSEEHGQNPLDARTAFYLAQTYYDLDMIPEAIQTYRTRANMDGWIEETYYARYRLGCLLSEHVSFAQGAKELLAAWELRPSRVEALRALSGAASNVADKVPPTTDRLFVHADAYRQPPRTGITADKVSAVIVTRGNVDLTPIIDSLPYDDIVIWNNAERDEDLRIFGRYKAMNEIKNDVVYCQDDDIVFTAHDALLAAYEPGVIVANMDTPWVEACGYDDMVLMGAGSIFDKNLPGPFLNRYLRDHPFDEEFMLECDFVLGTLAPGRKVDLGYTVRDFADDPDRLYRQPWQADAKLRVREKARAIRSAV